MKVSTLVSSLFLSATAVGAFAPINVAKSTSTRLDAALQEGDQVMLVGPGFLQLVLAKTCKAAGLRPLVVAPQKKLDSFTSLIKDDDIMKDSTIGMPEVGEEQFGKIAAIVFCAEDAVLPSTMVGTVLDYTDQSQSAFVEEGLKKVILCAPVSNKANEEKPVGWIPIFNNQDKSQRAWDSLVEAFKNHPMYKEGLSSIIRFGSLFGGSTDGPDVLKEVGLDEGIYKMSLEQYRDLKERAFDRYRLGAQVLEGDAINKKPPSQNKMEKDAFEKDEYRESFRILKGYPEEDRANRHTVAQAIVQTLVREDSSVPKEVTILGKAVSAFPTDGEWDQMFENPGPSMWPDPYKFDPVEYGVAEQEA